MVLLFFTFVPVLSLRSEKTDFIFSWQRAVEIFKENKKYFIPEIIDNIAEDVIYMVRGEIVRHTRVD
jgi:hypothetical protein